MTDRTEDADDPFTLVERYRLLTVRARHQLEQLAALQREQEDLQRHSIETLAAVEAAVADLHAVLHTWTGDPSA